MVAGSQAVGTATATKGTATATEGRAVVVDMLAAVGMAAATEGRTTATEARAADNLVSFKSQSRLLSSQDILMPGCGSQRRR